jgi:hypothetical protein
MAIAGRIGNVTLEVDGAWDIADLLALAESLSESYGLFYPLVADLDDVKNKLHDSLRKTFWSGDIDTRHIGRNLYRQIPLEESLKLKSFSYSSPGTLEVCGVLSCLLLLSNVASSWIRTSGELVDLWEKVGKFFEKRKDLRRPKRETELDDKLAVDADEARSLCFTVGEKLGFDAISCDTIISIAGNPFAALKYLVAAGNEGRKLARLQESGLLRLPPASGEPTSIPAARNGARKGRSGVIVENKRRKPRGR